MQHLPYLPLSVTEIEESPAFGSGEAALVRASLYLLEAAWRHPQTGSLSADVQTLARIARLGEQQLEQGWDRLFAGWELREDGRLWHPRLARLGALLQERYADELELIEATGALMMQPHEEAFDLVAPARKISANRGKRAYPKDFAPDDASRAAMERAGFVGDEEQQWLLQKFADFGQASRRMYVNWQAAFRNFLSSNITAKDFREAFGYRPGQRPVGQLAVLGGASSGASARDRLRASISTGSAPLSDTFAQRQLSNARTMMAAALARRQAQTFESEPEEAAPR